ncbi:MAG: aminomethyl-transferring glycine dehydrogenase subunit GcvPB [Thermoflexus hugenholtzii]|jgi:glycine dehydrogenase subunit 2|uniref:aminomethyl-transferring glycine dehydrogenase subunit GcvPB n=1 Tax=Thermoflexus TaxID=1495649 RepID=UPI001C778490|nr:MULTISPECIES: aminomethyl-transferring glycine dehydrogenase subunit GcvPB [Thermoflexus]QWK10721.1 MAG: aminomethyl-transferring glycine dehydrogenase subunit GcvPB [Thermoflexus hugenholtzii]
MTEPLIFEYSVPGRRGVELPEPDVPEAPLPEGFQRADLPLPEVSEVDVVRHFLRLSQMNYGVDKGFYPLGSCTMKYNPKINEEMARLPGFAHLHPYQDPETVQGALALMYHLQEFLKEIGGFAAVSLQPAAGSQGELAGILMIRAYHRDRGEGKKRIKMLIPDSAHGTNPASSAMAGLRVVNIPSDRRGNIDLDALRKECDETVAGLMITNPNTLGLFDENLLEAIDLVHRCGGLIYGDGANMNALMGICKPGAMGFDVMHYNLHKTFSTPHGGGGPGAGPIGASERLAPYLPGPIVAIDRERTVRPDEPFYTFVWPERSIGRVRAFHGHFGVFVRAYTYIRMHGPRLREVSEAAVLNANYLLARLRGIYPVPYDRLCKHEFVIMGKIPGTPIRALDISKRLMDYGFHPPTNYFPLIVPEALMIEPTETESKATLDAFAEAMRRIAEEAREDPERLQRAPHTTPVRRLDEARAARNLVLRYAPAPAPQPASEPR